MVKLTQINFGGGLNAFQPAHALTEQEYPLAFNLRIRDNQPTPIKGPKLEATRVPTGKKQGLYGFGQYLLLFNDGYAYYKDTNDKNAEWFLIPGIILDAEVDTIYIQAVPAATNNYTRQLQKADVINGTSADSRVDLLGAFIISGVAAGVVVQDGVSDPPYFIQITNGIVNGRRLNNYDQWTKDNREYVPRGKQMAYMNGILIVVAPDGKSFYRSVSGRPLDFVVNITKEGDKGGDAETTSYAVSGNEITAVMPMSSGDLLVGTLDGCYPVEFNYDFTIFQEPTFLNRRRFDAGLINQFSFIETLGDYNFIDQDGIRSFNAVSQLNYEGRNSVFSLKITNILNVQQSLKHSAAFVFDNYAFFSAQTNFGHAVLVYDTLRQVWVSIDFYGTQGEIKQFAATKLNIQPTLYAITETHVYQLFSGDEYLPATLHTREHVSNDPQVELQLSNVRCVFDGSSSDSIISVVEYCNGLRGEVVRHRAESSITGITYPAQYPVSYSTREALQNKVFSFTGSGRTGFKVGASIEWKSNAKLLQIQNEYITETTVTPLNQRGQIYASNS
jgi:hypothetical protein